MFKGVSEADGLRDVVTYTAPVLSGFYAVTLKQDEMGGGRYGCSDKILIYNLKARRRVTASEPDCDLVTVGSLQLDRRGFAAWHLTSFSAAEPPECTSATPCLPEEIHAYDSHGDQVVDSAPPGNSHVLTNLELNGELLTWTHDGTPRELTPG
jgi:hypothetical protein